MFGRELRGETEEKWRDVTLNGFIGTFLSAIDKKGNFLEQKVILLKGNIKMLLNYFTNNKMKKSE